MTSRYRTSNGRRGLLRAAASGLLITVSLAGTVMVTTSVLAQAASAGADPIGECTTTSGEIVVVDFARWGGNIERGCATPLSTGYAALQEAGFTTAGDEYDGPAFICRIDDDPPPSKDPCITTPPASAYWSYWHADAGQQIESWTPSQLGAMTYQPPPGSVDAWVFGDGSPPPFLPSSVRAKQFRADRTKHHHDGGDARAYDDGPRNRASRIRPIRRAAGGRSKQLEHAAQRFADLGYDRRDGDDQP